MWTFSFYVGNFVGPTAAGFVVESEGFRFASTVFCALYATMAALDAVDVCIKVSQGKEDQKNGGGSGEGLGKEAVGGSLLGGGEKEALLLKDRMRMRSKNTNGY